MDRPEESRIPSAIIIVQAPFGLEVKVQSMRMAEVKNIAIVVPNRRLDMLSEVESRDRECHQPPQ